MKPKPKGRTHIPRAILFRIWKAVLIHPNMAVEEAFDLEMDGWQGGDVDVAGEDVQVSEPPPKMPRRQTRLLTPKSLS